LLVEGATMSMAFCPHLVPRPQGGLLLFHYNQSFHLDL
jgi:hypothetical protein